MTTEHTIPETPAQDSPAQASPQPERDENGRFQKGNEGGPGNPLARQTARLRQAALDAVTAEDIRDIMTALKEKAKQGDVAASRLLLSYTIGKPGNAPDPDTMDQHELQTFIYNQTVPENAFLQILKGTPVEMVLLMLRGLLPVLLKCKMKTAADFVAHPAQPEEEEEETTETAQPGADNIPAWLWEVAQQHRAQAEPAPQPTASQEQMHLQPAKATDKKRLNPRDVVNPALDAGALAGLDPPLMRVLLERMGQLGAQPSEPPTTQRINRRESTTGTPQATAQTANTEPDRMRHDMGSG